MNRIGIFALALLALGAAAPLAPASGAAATPADSWRDDPSAPVSPAFPNGAETDSTTAPMYYGAPNAWSPAWYSYCGARYVTFDPITGTFLGYDGRRRMCK